MGSRTFAVIVNALPEQQAFEKTNGYIKVLVGKRQDRKELIKNLFSPFNITGLIGFVN